MKKLLLALVLLLAPLGAEAQNYTKNAAIIGAGPGVKSFLMVGPCTTGQVLTWTGGVAQCGSVAGSGTVTSVGLVLPTAVFTVTVSPITSSGNLTAIFANQSANQVFAGPTSGGPATPGFRALVGADLPGPTTTTLGGVLALSPISHQWINSITGGTGQPVASQPSFADISGSITPAQCPAAILNTLGCIQGINQTTSQWINSVVSGVPITSQPTFNDISGQIALTQLPTIANGTLLSNVSGGSATPSANTLSAILDSILGSTQGDIIYRGASVWTVLVPGTQGQVLATSGINQNPVWSTVSGTGTVTSIRAVSGLNATVANPITTAGNIGLAAINGNGDVLANTTGGSAVPSDSTLTSVLDAALGSTQGNIIYRGASTWVVLAPGTAGQVLSTSGVSANPIWASGASFQGSPGNPTNTASTTPVMGGFGGTCTITPITTGRVRFNINGSFGNTVVGDGIQTQLAYGTGTAPGANAAAAGTTAGNIRKASSTASNFWPFTNQAVVTGLTKGQAVWFDIQWAAITSGTAVGENIDCNANEY